MVKRKKKDKRKIITNIPTNFGTLEGCRCVLGCSIFNTQPLPLEIPGILKGPTLHLGPLFWENKGFIYFMFLLPMLH